MNKNKKAILPDRTAQVENLLRAARDYEPDGAAEPTEGLAARALARHRVRTQARRHRSRVLTLAGGMAAAATAAVIGVFFWQGVGTQKPSPQAVQVAAFEQPPVPVKMRTPSLPPPSEQPPKPAAVPSAQSHAARGSSSPDPREPASSPRARRRPAALLRFAPAGAYQALSPPRAAHTRSAVGGAYGPPRYVRRSGSCLGSASR